MKIIIEPNDVLLFRELKPFTAGLDNVVKSILPLPQTIAGAIRSRTLVEQNFSDDSKEYVGYGVEEPPENGLKVLGTFMWDREELLPTPMDVAIQDSKEVVVKPKNAFGVDFFYPSTKPVGGFIPLRTLMKFLSGEIEPESVVNVVRDTSKKFVKEIRIGIKLIESRVVEEEMLYSVEFLRVPGISVWVENLKFLPEKGLLRLGGEGRFARFVVGKNDSIEVLRDGWENVKDSLNGKMKLYVATPLLLENSGFYDWDVGRELKNLGLKVIKVIPLIGRPVKVGGWDMANNKPKGVRYAVPAGSVYFVEFEGKFDIDEPYLKLGKLTRLGYGLCFVGVWE